MANARPEKRKGRYPVILVSCTSSILSMHLRLLTPPLADTIAVRDIAFLKNLKYDMVVCDEAHKAKNLKGKTINALQLLKSEFRLLLTGTPLQNNLSELYALLFFILPHIFADQQLFENQFDFSSITSADGTKLSAEEEVQLLVVQLQMLLKPFMLRRCKKDVIKDLPLKKECVSFFLLSPLSG
jgi:ATP-dependent DNA helicase